MTNPKEDDIRAALSEIEDPELNRSLTELDMVREITTNGSQVEVVIALTVPGCPLKGKIESDIVDRLKQVKGVDAVRVKFDSMTDSEREAILKKIQPGGGQQPRRIKPS